MDPIYCIREASGCIRYIGVTHLLPEQRLKNHLAEARQGRSSHKLNWLRSLDYMPTIEVIEWVLPGDRVEREMYWIALFRDYGHQLVNGTDGGEGMRGLSAESRAKIGTANRDREVSLETRAKLAAASTGRPKSLETCAKLSKALRGQKRSPGQCEKIRAGKTGIKLSPEHCANISAAQTGVKAQNNTSGFVGVFRSAPRRWRTILRGRHIGIFSKIEDAVLARALTIALEEK